MSYHTKLFWKSFFITFALLLLLFTGLYFVLFESSPLGKSTPANEPAQVQKGGSMSILMALKPDAAHQPDAFTLITTNAQENTITTMTFPNNTAIFHEENTKTLGQLYKEKGMKQTLAAFAETYSIPLSHYASLTYFQLGELIHQFGEVRYHVFQKIQKENQEGRIIFTLSDGTQSLNGTQVAGLISYADLPLEEKNLLLDELLTAFFTQNASQDLVPYVSLRLNQFFNQKESNFNTIATQQLQQLFGRFSFSQMRAFHPPVTGTTQDDVFYVSDTLLHTIRELYPANQGPAAP